MIGKITPLRTSLLFVMTIVYISTCQGQIGDLFNGIALSDSISAVKPKIEGFCQNLHISKGSPVSFPLAKTDEQHLICEGYSIYDGYFQFSEVAFVFSDQLLSYIEVKGEGVKKLIDNEYYPGYRFFTARDNMIVNEEKKTAWFLSSEGLHTNLFAWSDPHLPSEGGRGKTYDQSAKVPDVFRFGADIDLLKPELEKQCKFISTQTFSEDAAQINCFGMEYAGFERKIEARFDQGKLYQLWILTAKAEEDRIREALKEAYAEPVFVDDHWEVFNNWQVSLRKDKPEVLVLSPEMAQEHKARLLQGER